MSALSIVYFIAPYILAPETPENASNTFRNFDILEVDVIPGK
jgi:hypothetical protein